MFSEISDQLSFYSSNQLFNLNSHTSGFGKRSQTDVDEHPSIKFHHLTLEPTREWSLQGVPHVIGVANSICHQDYAV
jgi:hypothetical protein